MARKYPALLLQEVVAKYCQTEESAQKAL